MAKKSGKPPGTRVRLLQRPRRTRTTAAVRSLARETRVDVGDLILPLFVMDGKNKATPIGSMPGHSRLTIDKLVEVCREGSELGIPAVALFPYLSSDKKDRFAKESANPKGLLQNAISTLKAKVPGLAVISDVAMDPYSSDGHDGLVRDGEIVNDETLPILAAMAIAQARAGADFVAPSDMMDGRIGYIRAALDEAGFEKTGILAYSAKYASAFYGPFREALDSAPRSGDKKTYQMDPSNKREAVREALLDVQQGADIVMVKPAGAYLDIIQSVRAKTSVPIAAYQVSGEFAMIHAAAERGWIDAPRAMNESLIAIKRAGADMILTYFALEFARAQNEA
ncbi:MAG: porphobilinogen synthase [Bdellovibrionota bacterium]